MPLTPVGAVIRGLLSEGESSVAPHGLINLAASLPDASPG